MPSDSLASAALSEAIAEDLAGTFLANDIGSDIFIGADIERILAKKVNVIYQDINDPNYSGAAISYRGVHFIALNTHQTLRARYYSAAHELWHLVVDTDLFGIEKSKYQEVLSLPAFNTERAADRFAAAIMLPRDVMIRTWHKYVNDQTASTSVAAQEAIVRIANISAMPYAAVTRRLVELDLLANTKLAKRTDLEWQGWVNKSSFPPSPLDNIVPFKKFPYLTQVVKRLVKQKQLSLMEAAQLTTYADPKTATSYLNKRQKIVDKLEAGE